MILQMKQTTKFWKIGMGTFNNYLLCVCFMGNDYKKQTNKQSKQTCNFFFFLGTSYDSTVEPFLLFIPWNTKIHSAQV